MAQLRQDYPEFVQRDAEIVVVGPEAAPAFKEYWTRESISFIGLPDPGHTVLKRFGQKVSLFKLGRMPAQIIIDKQGIVRFVHYGHSMMDIPANKELLDLLDQLGREQDTVAEGP